MLQKTINSFKYALRGLVTVWQEERNFRIESVTALIVSICMVYFRFSFVESSILVIAMALVLLSEIVNTVIEDLCNKVEPKHDSVIGKIKDTSGAFVLVAVIGSVVVGVLVFCNHFL